MNLKLNSMHAWAEMNTGQYLISSTVTKIASGDDGHQKLKRPRHLNRLILLTMNLPMISPNSLSNSLIELKSPRTLETKS